MKTIRLLRIVLSIIIIGGCTSTKPPAVPETGPSENITTIVGYVLYEYRGTTYSIPKCEVSTIPAVTSAITDSSGKFVLRSREFENIEYEILVDHRPAGHPPNFKRNSTMVIPAIDFIQRLKQPIYLVLVTEFNAGNLPKWEIRKGDVSFEKLPNSESEWSDYSLIDNRNSKTYYGIVWMRTNTFVSDPSSYRETDYLTVDIETQSLILECWVGSDSLYVPEKTSGRYSIKFRKIPETSETIIVALRMKVESSGLLRSATITYHKKEQWEPPLGPDGPVG